MDDYQISATKYRPTSFKEVVGQDAVTSTLENAINKGKLGQALLFSGPRGENAIEKYVNLAQKHSIAPSTFANAFVNDRPFVTSNIIGATTMEQLKENIDSIDITLSKEVLKEIQDIHLSDPNPCV